MAVRFVSQSSSKILFSYQNCIINVSRNVRIKRWPTIDNPWIDQELSKKPEFEKRPDTIGYRSDPSLFQFVKKILPQDVIPDPPASLSYPTPSGWVPPTEEALKHPYLVRRTRNHQMPVYFEEADRKTREQTYGKRRFTVIKRIDGDIWKLDSDLRAILEPKCEGPYLSQVHEVSQKIRIEGLFHDEVVQFLLDRGF